MAQPHIKVTLTGASQLDQTRLIYLFVFALIGIFVLLPVSLTMMNSFIQGEIGQSRSWSLQPWQEALNDPAIFNGLKNTLKVILFNELISMPIAIFFAWLLGRTDLPGRHGLEFIFWISFFLPSLSVTMGWIALLDPQGGVLNHLVMQLPFISEPPFNIYSFWGIVWAHLGSSSVSVKIMLLTPAFRNLDASYEEAAMISGAKMSTVLVRIILPLMAPAIMTVLVLSTIKSIQSFEIEMVLGPPNNFWVFGTLIYRNIEQLPPHFATAAALASLTFIGIIPLIIAHRWILGRRNYTALSGRIRLAPMPLGKWRGPAFLLVAISAFVLTGLPVSFVVLSSFMKFFGFFDIPEPWTISNWQQVLADPFFLRSLLETLKLALGAGFTCVVLSALIAYFVVRGKYAGRVVLDFLSWLPFAIPGILFGVGLLSVILGSPILKPFYGTLLIMILATSIAHLTMGTQIVKSALIQLDQNLEDAAHMSGADFWVVLIKIIAPILAPTLVLVAVSSFIGATRDIASVALLATNETKPLSLLQLDYLMDGRSESAAVMSVIVIILTTGLALICRMIGLRLSIR